MHQLALSNESPTLYNKKGFSLCPDAKIKIGSQGISSGAIARWKIEKSSLIFQQRQIEEGNFAKEQKKKQKERA